MTEPNSEIEPKEAHAGPKDNNDANETYADDFAASDKETEEPIRADHSAVAAEPEPAAQPEAAANPEAADNQTAPAATGDTPQEAAPPQPKSSPKQSKQRSTPRNNDDLGTSTFSHIPQSARHAVAEEHERHKERLEAIATGRSTSQATSNMSARRGSPPRHKQADMSIRKSQDVHNQKIASYKQSGPMKLPMVATINSTRIGNTHAPVAEFYDPKRPGDPNSARDHRLLHNRYRSERLNKAERVDEENAKIVSTLMNVRSVIPPTVMLLQQERERQRCLRRIERGPSTSPRSSADSFADREMKWDNHVTNVIPRAPFHSTLHATSRPKAIWDEKLTLAKDLEQQKLQHYENKEDKDNERPEENTTAMNSSTPRENEKPKKTRRPVPPLVPLAKAIEKIPPNNASTSPGRGKRQPEDSNVNNEEPTKPVKQPEQHAPAENPPAEDVDPVQERKDSPSGYSDQEFEGSNRADNTNEANATTTQEAPPTAVNEEVDGAAKVNEENPYDEL